MRIYIAIIKLKNNLLNLGMTLGAVFVFASPAYAVCPVCTIAVGAGLGLSRWLGIDDTISGIWVGGLIVSSLMWFLSWLDRKKIQFIFRDQISAIVFYLTIILPLYYANIIGHPNNKLWGIDKLLVGIMAGSIMFLIGVGVHSILKKRKGQSYFHFQKVALPISALAIASLIFYFLTKVHH